MEGIQPELIGGIAILIVLAFLATVDIAVSKLSDVQLRRLMSDSEEEGRKRFASELKEIVTDRGRFRFVFSVTMQMLQIGFTVLALVAFQKVRSGYSFALYAFAFSVVASIVIRQVVPYLILKPGPENALAVMLPLAGPFYNSINSIVSLFAKKDGDAALHMTVPPDKGQETEDEDEATDQLQALIEVGEAEGIIEEEERELIETVVHFSDTRVGEIMTPRTEICALSVEATVTQARDLMIEEKYSRVPVYRENIDNIEGVVYIRDLLNAWAENREDQAISSLLRPAYFVPETKPVSELLKKMQSAHVQIAVVIDEYGGVAGLISVEDIVEELVGEIEDEDTEAAEVVEIVKVADGVYDILGSTEIDKLERLFGIDFEDGDFTTIAGVVTSEAGYVPKDGETIDVHGLRVEVLKADEKRINLLRVQAVDGESAREETSE